MAISRRRVQDFWAMSAIVAVLVLAISSASAQTLERIAASGVFKIGYREDAPPFSFMSETGAPAGYTVDLCRRVAADAKEKLGLAELSIEFVGVGTQDRFDAVSGGGIDILCGATTATLSRRETVSFSLPTFITGVSALLRADASPFLRGVLAGRQPAVPPRMLVLEAFRDRKFGVRAETTAANWLQDGMTEIATSGKMIAVSSHEEGVKLVREGGIDAYFADRAILGGLVVKSETPGEFLIGERLFTYEPYALAIARGDEEFRLFVDRTLSRLYRTGEIAPIFAKYFGAPDQGATLLFLINSLPE